MLGSQFPVGLLVVEQMINDNQDAMSQGHDGFLVSHALAEPLVIGSQKGLFAVCSGLGSLNESLPQPPVPLACRVAEPFARIDLGCWTQTRPGTKMGFGGKAIHHGAKSGRHNLASAHIDTSHLIEQADRLTQRLSAGSRDNLCKEEER